MAGAGESLHVPEIDRKAGDQDHAAAVVAIKYPVIIVRMCRPIRSLIVLNERIETKVVRKNRGVGDARDVVHGEEIAKRLRPSGGMNLAEKLRVSGSHVAIRTVDLVRDWKIGTMRLMKHR